MKSKKTPRYRNGRFILDGIIVLDAKRVTKGKAGGAIIEVNRSVYMSH